MLMLVVDVDKPWLDTSRFTQNILFIDRIIRGLLITSVALFKKLFGHETYDEIQAQVRFQRRNRLDGIRNRHCFQELTRHDGR